MDLLWSPAHHQIGDPTIIRVGDEYHLFSEMAPLDPERSGPGSRVVGHAVSRDLFRWEELPIALHCGPPGSFDACNIYHMDVLVHEGTWWMFYTGLDRGGPGEQQSIGLATSPDGLTWTKHPGSPILRADPRWYEPAIPREATYQEKDFGRLWFRDPCVVHDSPTGRWVMIVVARDAVRPPDVRGCLALATSEDLVRWELQPPIFSTGRFHTIETPSLFERDGLWYLVYMTHPGWGPPVIATDPYQDAGDFYAISRSGPTGPFERPADEVLVASNGRQQRMGACRTVDGPEGERYLYGWLRMEPGPGDCLRRRGPLRVIPPPRRVRFDANGAMHTAYHEGIERFCVPAGPYPAPEPREPARWDEAGTAKHLQGRTMALYPVEERSVIFRARLQFQRGERAGLVLRADATGTRGWTVIADRRFGRIEFGLLDEPGFIDARAWKPADEVELRVVAYEESVEVYADDRLMIHQVRHREQAGRLGLIVERAEAHFPGIDLLRFRD